MSNYDVTIGGVGFMLDRDNANPATRQKTSPTMQPGVPQQNSPYSARDSDPPWPLEFSDWRGGAGQVSLDSENARWNAYAESSCLDPTQDGNLELGPGRLLMPFNDVDGSGGLIGEISNVAVKADKVWAAFTKNDAGDQIRRLKVGTDAQSGANHLNTTSATSLYMTTGGLTGYLYCPVHAELILITAEPVAKQYTVTRACGSTTAHAHDAGETWRYFTWEDAAWAIAAPATPVQAMCTDGEKIYASLHTLGADGGDVYCGKAAGADAADWNVYCPAGHVAATDIIDLTYCGGLLYAVKNTYTGSAVTAVQAGSLSGATGAFSAITGASVIFPAATSAGLETLGTYVYWAVSGGGKSWVYMIQDPTTFQLVTELPFVATSICAHLGNVYVGGYVDTGTLFVNDTSKSRYEGIVYVLAGGSDPALLCNIGGNRDKADAVRALSAFGNFIYILTDGGIYRYDLKSGGWHHYADLPTSTGFIAGSGADWETAEMFDADDATHPDDYASPWTKETVGTPAEELTFTSMTYYTPPIKVMQTVVKNKHNSVYWYKDDAALIGACTLDTVFADARSQAGFFSISDGNKRALVRITGQHPGQDWDIAQVSLASWVDGAYVWSSTTTTQKYTDTGEYGGPSTTYEFASPLRVTLEPTSGAIVYVGGELALTVAYSDLPAIDDGASADEYKHSARVCWGCGWPFDRTQTDTYNERLSVSTVKWSNAAAYPYGYVGGTQITTPESLVVDAGSVWVPLPSYCLAYVDPLYIAGEGGITHSQTTLKTGLKLKQFASIGVLHSALQEDQTLSVEACVDGKWLGAQPLAASSDSEALTLETIPINKVGRSLATRLTFTDAMSNRPPAQRIHIANVTAYFTALPGGATWTYVFNVSDKVQMRNGQLYDIDPATALAYLSDSLGALVAVESAYGDYSGYIMGVTQIVAPTDLTRGDRNRGKVQVTVKEAV